ncbi:hypothetical protein AVEN_71422-1 [Araneus ventricosus]|uniref:Integrase catalytic domain-containing protein n=1 Tax=Araneus ventricosus TaxID=182803 RepID=A0A4Y2BJK4_ARAVE|nr:hypothetical protein AVEN_71422-1 [Araneus ventricosus]
MSNEPTPLPPDRVSDCAVFEIVGIDLAGPLFLKNGEKVWIAVFTCAFYRAIHLELVRSLSSNSFYLAMRRFIARRGRPKTIYSDNGKNFKGSCNELSKLDWNQIQREANLKRMSWKLNPPTASWRGGWWERLVRVIKELLRRTLGNSVFSFEELETVICGCESVINSRPLTYISKESRELVPLTPSMFLIENRCSDVTDFEAIDQGHFQKRIRFRSKLLNDLKQRFRRDSCVSNPNLKTDTLSDAIVRKYTRCGRCIKTPEILDLLNCVSYRFECLIDPQRGENVGQAIKQKSEREMQ